jgi:hypothetical protein
VKPRQRGDRLTAVDMPIYEAPQDLGGSIVLHLAQRPCVGIGDIRVAPPVVYPQLQS